MNETTVDIILYAVNAAAASQQHADALLINRRGSYVACQCTQPLSRNRWRRLQPSDTSLESNDYCVQLICAINSAVNPSAPTELQRHQTTPPNNATKQRHHKKVIERATT